MIYVNALTKLQKANGKATSVAEAFRFSFFLIKTVYED